MKTRVSPAQRSEFSNFNASTAIVGPCKPIASRDENVRHAWVGHGRLHHGIQAQPA